MSQRKVFLAEGEYYHIYNRGNSKQDIFRDNADRHRFQQLLYGMNSDKSIAIRLINEEDRYSFDRGERQVAIGAYCLMPNHFHILLKPLKEDGVQNFIQKMSTSYSMYFNKRHERTGSLFEGRFKSQHAESEEYLKYLFSYIHLNPLKLLQADWRETGLSNIINGLSYLQRYQYSSFTDYLGVSREQNSILERDSFPEYFPTPTSFLDEIQDWMKYSDFVSQD